MKLLIILLALSLTACDAGKNRTQVDIIQDTMKDQISLKAQDWDPKRPGEKVSLLPPEGTLAQNHKPYRFTDPVTAGNKLKDPFADSGEMQEMGKKYYQIYCGVCHGSKGDGQGSVAAKMLIKPPSLITGFVSKYKDGHYYHTIVNGKGVMGQYGGQIRSEKQRWAIVKYIRTLQGKN